MHSYEEYVDLVNNFSKTTDYKPYDYRGRFFNDIIERYISEHGNKTPIDYRPEELLDFLVVGIGIKKVATYNNYKADYKHFYDWLIDRGVIKNNICDSAILSHESALAKMVDSADTVIITPEDIDMICASIGFNKVLDRAIVRTLYENIVPSGAEISLLKKSDFDPEERTIIYEGRKRRVSKELANLYGQLDLIENRHSPNGNKYDIYHHSGDLFPTTVQFKGDEKYAKRYSVYIKRELYHISEQARMKITSQMLHDGGMICALVKRFGKDEFCRLMEDRRGRSEIKTLQTALNDLGYHTEAERVDWFRHRYVLIARQIKNGAIEI